MYEIYIGDLKLPLLPETLTESVKKDNRTYNMLAMGEVVRAGRSKLRIWNIKTILEHDKIDVTFARDYLMSLVESDEKATKPVRLIVNRYKDDGSLTFDTNSLVLIESIDFEDKAGEVGDLNFSLKLIEYKEFGGKVLK